MCKSLADLAIHCQEGNGCGQDINNEKNPPPPSLEKSNLKYVDLFNMTTSLSTQFMASGG